MRHVFDPCPDEQAFHFAHGGRARSLEEFRLTLDEAPPEVLYYHREHFPRWVRDVLDAPALADHLVREGQKAEDGERLRNRIEDHLDKALDQLRGQPAAASGAAPRGGKRATASTSSRSSGVPSKPGAAEARTSSAGKAGGKSGEKGGSRGRAARSGTRRKNGTMGT